MPEASTDPFGIGTAGFTPYGAMDALYPYVTYGPNMGFNLLDLQTKANMQANLANQNMAWNLAQAAGSGNLMDNFAKQMYLGGLAAQPGMTSALNGLPSPFIGQTDAGAGYNQMLQGLPPWMQGGGNVIGTGAPPSTAAPSNAVGALQSLQGGDQLGALNQTRAIVGLPPLTALPPGYAQAHPFTPTSPLPTGGGSNIPQPYYGERTPAIMPGSSPFMDPRLAQTPGPPIPVNGGVRNPGDMVPLGTGGAYPGLANGGSLGPGESAIVGEVAPEVVRFENGRVVVSPIKYGMQTGGSLYDTDEYKPPTTSLSEPSQPSYNVTDLPFYKQFQSGTVGPAWNANMARPTAPALGINEGVKLPWEVAATYQRSNPMYKLQQQQLWQTLGIPPEWSDYWIQSATPGYRQFGQRALAF